METSFCSRCGFLLTGTAELIKSGGALSSDEPKKGLKVKSRRNRGIKQGLFIFLLTFLVVPIIAIFTIASRSEPYVVVIASILLAVGGLLRMAYALMFESSESIQNESRPVQLPGTTFPPRELPSQQTYPAASYISPQGRWKDTNDLEPKSVTENTTKLLENEESF
jgi:hypothetical protein